MLNKTIRDQLRKRKTVHKVNAIRSIIGFRKYPFTERDFVNLIQELDKKKIGSYVEIGCFKFTKSKNSFKIEPKISFRINKDVLDDLFIEKTPSKEVKK